MEEQSLRCAEHANTKILSVHCNHVLLPTWSAWPPRVLALIPMLETGSEALTELMCHERT